MCKHSYFILVPGALAGVPARIYSITEAQHFVKRKSEQK